MKALKLTLVAAALALTVGLTGLTGTSPATAGEVDPRWVPISERGYYRHHYGYRHYGYRHRHGYRHSRHGYRYRYGYNRRYHRRHRHYGYRHHRPGIYFRVPGFSFHIR